MSNKTQKIILLAVILVLGLFLLKSKRAEPQYTQNSSGSQLLMEWQEIAATGVSREEKERIVSFVDTFERAVAQRDSEKVLSFFSDPETDEEQKDLDFILWRDVDPASKQGSRLFLTAGYNYSLAGHYVRGVTVQEAHVRVLVDEMRVIPSGGEWVGYAANVARLVVELRETAHGYKIERYYHENAPQDHELKYEGFIAE